ncbi:MAG: hypothetical protein HC828_07270 [Blastochloris sp.]|nr:hypothetical protein [Blastochloris sp.]
MIALRATLTQRLQRLPLDSGLVSLLTSLAHADVAQLVAQPQLGRIFPALQQAFRPDPDVLAPFQAA